MRYRTTMLCGMATALSVAAAGILHASEAAAPYYQGVVITALGEPAAGCKVLLLAFGFPDWPAVVEETTSDEQGRFAFRAPRGERLTPMARDGHG
jgi:hypothetical protein